jgi:peptidoglycan hydrolase-like protein with peptidoglycan-binding domain
MNLKYKMAAAASFAALVLPGISAAQTVDQMEAQIQMLLTQLQVLQHELSIAQGGPGQWCYTFNTNLRIGTSGSEVTALQTALQKDGESVSLTGTFDEQVASAVSGFQEKYATTILTPNNLQHGTGYVGSATRAKLNELYGCAATSPTPVPTSVPTPIPSPDPSSPLSSAPYISGITPSVVPIGAAMTITGSGFRTSGLMLTNGDWKILMSVGEATSDNSISITLPAQICLVPALNSSGCSSYEYITPGQYWVYAVPLVGGTNSNQVSFTVPGTSTTFNPTSTPPSIVSQANLQTSVDSLNFTGPPNTYYSQLVTLANFGNVSATWTIAGPSWVLFQPPGMANIGQGGTLTGGTIPPRISSSFSVVANVPSSFSGNAASGTITVSGNFSSIAIPINFILQR